MRLLGLEISRTKAVPPTAVPVTSQGSWWASIRESFTGAWQQNVTLDTRENMLAFSAVYACIALISDDIAKLRVKLLRLEDDIWEENEANSPYLPVLKKPNPYQTSVQFWSYYFVTKLIYGNAYVLKQRDARGIVVAKYILDPRLVTPLVTPEGDVYYDLRRDPLSRITMDVVIPASEIDHDRAICLWHPLVGVSPIYACAMSATQGRKIQTNSEQFFKNMSRPSGQLTAPGAISDDNAKRLKEEFEKNFSGSNIGRLLVTGDGLKYEPMTIPANEAQLIEQLRWTVEDVARCFKVPLYKLGVGQPTLNNIGQMNQEYYAQCLQMHIEAAEALQDQGLALPPNLSTEFDLEGLLRMDPVSRADRYSKLGGVMAPNEARKSENLKPVVGGDLPYLQQQNYSLEALARRDAQADPFAKPTPTPAPVPTPAPAPAPEDAEDAAEAEFAAALIKEMREAAYA